MKKKQQKKWDKRFLQIAANVSEWSKDSTQIGSVIVGSKNQIIAQGYNGFPRGIADTEERYKDRQTKLDHTIHSEQNCIYNCIHSNSSPLCATIYVAGLPVCHECAKAIIQVGIKRVVMNTRPEGTRWEKSGILALQFFDEAGIKYKFITD